MAGKSLLTIVAVFILVSSAFAQTETTPNPASTKVGVIDTNAFYDKEKGIREAVAAQAKLDAEFRTETVELKILAGDLQRMFEELRGFAGVELPPFVTAETAEGKFKDYETALARFKKRDAEIKTSYKNRKAEIFADVYKKIGDAIRQYAKEKGYAIIVDISAERSFLPNYGDNDVTEAFINYYNEIYTKLKTQ